MMIWYSAGCGYWTDDFNKLHAMSGIPSCPICMCPGCTSDIEDWNNGVKGYDDNYPGYEQWLNDNKEKCFGNGLKDVLITRGFITLDQ